MKRPVVAVIAVAIVVAAVAGVVLVRRDSGTHTPARIPIALSSRAAEGAVADAALAPYGKTTYHRGPVLPALDGSARAFRVTASDPAAGARRLAEALGLQGEASDNGDGGVVLTDGSSQLVVTTIGWYFSRDPNGAVSSGAAVACPPDAPKCVPQEAPPPSRPVDLPSEADAKAIGIAFLQRAGIDTDGATTNVDDSVTQWFVSIQPVVDGTATEGLVASVVVGDHGTIESASGFLGEIVAADEYPLIGTSAAIDRLNRGEVYAGGGNLEAQTAIASDEVGSASASGATGAPGSVAPAEPPAAPIPAEPPFSGSSEPPPVLTVPEPATDVTLTRADLVLLYVTSYDGSEGWLVPAYRFITADGPGPVVIAVDERFLMPPEGVGPRDMPAPEPASASDGGR